MPIKMVGPIQLNPVASLRLWLRDAKAWQAHNELRIAQLDAEITKLQEERFKLLQANGAYAESIPAQEAKLALMEEVS